MKVGSLREDSQRKQHLPTIEHARRSCARENDFEGTKNSMTATPYCANVSLNAVSYAVNKNKIQPANGPTPFHCFSCHPK
eukprot:2119354-Amphidinium_carterae.2